MKSSIECKDGKIRILFTSNILSLLNYLKIKTIFIRKPIVHAFIETQEKTFM